MAELSTRRRFLAVSGMLGATTLAGCAGLGSGTEPTETATRESMDDGMADSMTATTDESMAESLPGDGMTAMGFTEQLELWDAGIEVNQEPGAGTDQAPRQDDSNTGDAEDDVVRPIGSVDDGYRYPATTDVIKFTIASGGMDS